MPGIQFGNTGGLDIQPRIIGPSEGDLEQARIRRLLDLAHLDQLRREPGLQERQLSLQERNSRTSETLGFANLSLEQKKAEVGRFLAENNVKHDAGALAEANRHNVATETQSQKQIDASKMTQVFGDLSRMPVDPVTRTKLLADYMAENGDPTLQKVLANSTAATTKKGDYSEAAGTVPTSTTPVADALTSQTPGYDPELGKTLLKGVTDIPLAMSNLGGQIYNYGIAAPTNLINSIVGSPPLQRAKWAGNYAEALGYTTPTTTPKVPVTPTKTYPTIPGTRKAYSYDGPAGYPDTTSAKKKARQRRGASEFAY